MTLEEAEALASEVRDDIARVPALRDEIADLTLHGGSSPMGAQASSLMPCVFQDCCFAPEGGAPA